MAYQTVDPIQRGLQTYGMAENIKAQKESRLRATENHDMRKENFEAGKQERAEGKQKKQVSEEQARSQKIGMAYIGRQIHARKNGLKAVPTDAELDALASNPLLSVDFLESDEAGRAIETGNNLFQKKIPLSSPEVAQAITTLSPDLQKGSPGKKTVNQAFLGRSDGTLMLDLAVDGKGGYPLTENRSSDDNDPVKEIPFEPLINRFKSVEQMRKFVGTREGQDYLESVYLDYAGKTKEKKESYGDIVTKNGMTGQYDSSGRFHQLDSRKGVQPTKNGFSVGGKSTLPKEAQMIEYLKQSYQNDGVNLTTKQARLLANEAVHNPQKYIENYIGDAVALQNGDYFEGEKKDIRVIEREAVDSQKRIQEMLYGDNKNGATEESSSQDASYKTPKPIHLKMLNEAPEDKRQEIEAAFVERFGALPEGYQTSEALKKEAQKEEPTDPALQSIDLKIDEIQEQIDSLPVGRGGASSREERSKLEDQIEQLEFLSRNFSDLKGEEKPKNNRSRMGANKSQKAKLKALQQIANTYSINIDELQVAAQ